MVFNDFASDGFPVPDAAIIRPLRTGIALGGKAERSVGAGIPKRVLLFETEPKITVVIVDRGTTVGAVRRAIGIEHFAHHEVSEKDCLYRRLADEPPGACSVDEPSKDHIGASSTCPPKFSMILVLLRKLCVG